VYSKPILPANLSVLAAERPAKVKAQLQAFLLRWHHWLIHQDAATIERCTPGSDVLPGFEDSQQV
jgi:hypothetical protein